MYMLHVIGRSSLSDKCIKNNVCHCRNGVAVPGAECPLEGINVCASCHTGFYLFDVGSRPRCIQHTDCEAEGKKTLTPGTGTADTQCGGPNKCRCDHGTAATSIQCPKHLNYKCLSCNASYWLDATVSKPNLRPGDAICSPHTDCDAQGRLLKTVGTPVADAVCGDDKKCICQHGANAIGIACPKDGLEKCVSCAGKYYLDNGLCLPWQDCDETGKVEVQPASNTANAQCGRAKQCTCDRGTGATGLACPVDGLIKCVECDPSHWLDSDHKCKKWTDCDAIGHQVNIGGTNVTDNECGDVKVCKCPHGAGATSIACPAHDVEKCLSCTGNFFLEGNACNPHRNCNAEGRVQMAPGTSTSDALCGADKRCKCTNGVGANGTACPSHGLKCVACSPNFYLSNDACEPLTNCDDSGKVQTKDGNDTADVVCGADKKCICANGAHATGKSCPQEGNARCISCHADYFLDDIACKPHTNCDQLGLVTKSLGTGTKNAVCGRLKLCSCYNGQRAIGTACPKDSDAKCVICNDSYFLDGAMCKPWTDCSKQGKTLETPGTNIIDAVCGGDKKCICQHGANAIGIACPKDGLEKCVSCAGKYYLDNGLCLPWQDCDETGKVEVQPASNTANAQCGRAKQCTCDRGTGATGLACPVDGLIKCVECDPSHWLDSDHKCKKRTDCDSWGQLTEVPGSKTADAVCGTEKVCNCDYGLPATGLECPLSNPYKCIECIHGFFLDKSVCKPQTNCDLLGRTVTQGLTELGDVICGSDKTCLCPRGFPAMGTNCPLEGYAKCVKCAENFFLEDSTCKPNTDCSALGKVQVTPPTNVTDATCGTLKQCLCKHGLAASGTACPTDGDYICISCNELYWLDKGKCNPRTNCDLEGRTLLAPGGPTFDNFCGELRQCTCPNGTPAQGKACSSYGALACTSCDSGFFMFQNKCEPHRDCDAEGRLLKILGTGTMDTECGDDKQCTCDNHGVGATGVTCPTHRGIHCGSCDDGYWLNKGKCTPRKDCNSLGLLELEAGGLTTDAICGREKRCVCTFGTAATGKRCADDKMHSCDSCGPQYSLQDRKCTRVDIPRPETTTPRPSQPPEVVGYSILLVVLIIVLVIILVIVDYFLHERECECLTHCFERLSLICEPKKYERQNEEQ